MDESGVAWLRGDWVPAVEESLLVADPHQFMRWMERHLRPMLGYQMVICATGAFAPQSFAADRILVRGVPQRVLEALRDSAGVIVLPRARGRGGGSLRLLEGVAAFDALGPVAALDALDGVARRGCYFVFARLRAVPGERQAYLAEVLAPHMRTLLARCLAHDPDPPARAHADSTLTRRELELLQWLVAGRTTADIARSTFRSTHTVSNQVRAILRKLRASNRTEAIAVALGLGLVAPVERQGVTRVMAAQVPLAYQVSRRRRHSRHQRATRVFRLDNESSAGGDR